MIPRHDVQVAPHVPPTSTFWVPDTDDLSYDGVGFFMNTWLIINAEVEDAREVIEAEKLALAYVDARSATAEEFEALAIQVESECPDEPSSEAPDFIAEGQPWAGLEGLEIGVAGLVMALAARGFVPVASCRSHHSDLDPWTCAPVVIFAGDREQVEGLVPHVVAAGCGFDIDENRTEFLCVTAPSIIEMMELAQVVIDDDTLPMRRYELPDR